MPTRPDPNREQFWRDLLRKRTHSTLTLAAFCQQHGITASAYYFWKRTLALREARHSTSTFIPVTVVPEPTATIEVQCPSGHIVRIAGMNTRTLHEIFAALAEKPSC